MNENRARDGCRSANLRHEDEKEYDDSVPVLWQSVIDLGASLPPEEWERLPRDLAMHLDSYLYGWRA